MTTRRPMWGIASHPPWWPRWRRMTPLTVTLPDPNPVALDEGGETTITVTVTAEDASTTQNVYRRTVTREAPMHPMRTRRSPTLPDRSLDENTMSVVTLAATDDDDDAITGFAVVEKTGSDHAAFEIDANDNGLAFKEAPDHENPTDVGGDASGDNIYYVTVECDERHRRPGEDGGADVHRYGERCG